ncbi:hypothetical protein NIES4071_93710 [Calothrix sp. NIES-4071]|nr:hypothetical protein NIES4071_93710 [Calothrix sp. NIES-4071]BAZ63636.1 hypothetical protein NIES4105_93640 [Calothrix sp. NIES-4105]
MDLEYQIKLESSQAAKFSKEANREFAAKNFAAGKALMKQAVEAGRRCQSLIQQYNQGNTTSV